MSERPGRQRRGVAALLALAIVMTGLAVWHRGVPAAELDLNDGGVWVTNLNLQKVGHLNYPSRTLDGGLIAGSGDFDVTQAANDVVVHDQAEGRAQNVSTTEFKLSTGTSVPSPLSLVQGGSVAAVSDAAAGKVWTMPADGVDSFRPDNAPAIEDSAGVRAVVGVDGVTHAVLPDGAVRKIVDGQVSDEGRIQDLKDLASASLTTVGDQVVVFDKASSAVRTTRGSVAVDNAGKVVLQQPGPASDKVLLAGPDSYLQAPIGGGVATALPSGGSAGTPAQPAVLDGCAYLAWSGSGAYVRDCVNDGDDQRLAVDKIKGYSQAVFRINRDVIVLNDSDTGSVLLVNDDMREVNNWQVVDSATQSEKEDDSNTVPSDELSQSDKLQKNTNPIAKDDVYGARPGSDVELPVLENDSDADGDLLTASVKTQPRGMPVSQVRGGEALSLSVPKGDTGAISFTYTASDGRTGTDTASVRVNIVGPGVENAPEQKRKPVLSIAHRGEATYSLLGDFRDPESDPIYLVGASQPTGLSVKWRPDGVLTVKDLGTAGAGRKEIRVEVSDGDKTGTGVVYVQVRDGRVPPIANVDHVTVLKGENVVVRPLANDVDPMGGQLRLSSVGKPGPGQTIQPDFTAGTFQFSAATPGTVYVSYQVSNYSPKASTGYVRIDVVEPGKGRPIPGHDLAMLPAGGSVLVDALANDTDPAGGVLVVKSVSTPANGSVAVELLQHNLLRVSAPVGLQGPVTFTYLVSNGSGEAFGNVTVVPLPATAGAPPPIAVDDRAVVRQFDIVTIPVLHNDRSPAGLPLALSPKVAIEGDASAGDVFVAGDTVRFRAKKGGGSVRITYTVGDSGQQYSSAQVIVDIVPLEQKNQPPVPQPVTGRVLAGGTITLPVPTDGIDPDGDSVTLLGVKGPAKIGTATMVAGAIEYTAPTGAAGTDSFTYEVADRFGARATGTIRVGVAPPNTTNQSPVAVPDDVTTRPGRALAVNPVRNDVDPDGDVLGLIGNSVQPADDATATPTTIDGDLVNLTTPDQEGTLQYYYGVSDGHSGDVRGAITIRVSKDAELRAPVAKDDLVTAAQVNGVPTVTVDVRANDYDPDGSVKQLTVSTSDAGVSVVDNRLAITVTDQRQVVLYRVTDQDGKSAEAAVVVPPSTGSLPYLDETKLPLEVQAGTLLTIPLRDYVIVRQGRTPLVTFAATVVPGPGGDPDTEWAKDARTLQFRSTPEYVGASAVTFEVTDGTSAEDTSGLKATLSLPIKVLPAADAKHQPVFTPSTVTVAAGDGPKVVDLAQMVTDPDPGDLDKLRFTAAAPVGTVSATLSGSKLTVTAPPDAAPGDTGHVAITVTDGSTEPVSGEVPVKVTASTRPLIAMRPATITDAKAGSPSTIDLSSYLTNPFAKEGKPLTILDSPTVVPAGPAVSVSGLAVTVTPPVGYHGQLLVTYLVQDATKQVSRQVRGTIQVTVRDRPDPPVAVSAETHLSHTATVSWTAGPNNGAPITGFTVSWDNGKGIVGARDCGAVTTCLLTTLENATPYTFRVAATNEVGTSDQSAPSNTVTPDVKPNPPGTPSGTFGDRQVALTWAAATTDGSPVSSYTVEISPAVGGRTQQDVVGGTSLTWTGLTNGTAYTFRVQAHSAAPQPSDWSGSSAAVVPAGKPFTPAAPNVNKDPASTLQPSATITWAAPDGNGDSNLTYTLRRVGSTAVLYSGTATSAHVTMSVSTSDQTFEVQATNKAGSSPWSPESNAVRAFQTPGAVGGLSVTPTGTNNQVKIAFTAAAANGALPSEIQYYWQVGGSRYGIAAGGATVTNASAFPNGANASVAVYAVSTVKGDDVQGPSTSATVSAYGPPVAPAITCSPGINKVSCAWSGGTDGGRSATYSLASTTTESVGASGTKTYDVPGGVTVTACITVTQSTGLQDKSCSSAKAEAPVVPSPTVTVSHGTGAVGQPGCASAGCAFVRVTTANFSGNVSCTLQWWSNSTNTIVTKSTWTQGPNETLEPGAYYGYTGHPVIVTCGGVQDSITW